MPKDEIKLGRCPQCGHLMPTEDHLLDDIVYPADRSGQRWRIVCTAVMDGDAVKEGCGYSIFVEGKMEDAIELWNVLGNDK